MNATNRITLTCRLLSPTYSGSVARIQTVFGRVLWAWPLVGRDAVHTLSYCSCSCCKNYSKVNSGFEPKRIYDHRPYKNKMRELHTSAIRGAVPSEKPRRQVVRRAPDEKKFGELTTGEKVARVSKDATYTGVIVLGIGVTCVMFYAIGRELFSSESSSGVYGKALKMCRKSDEVSDTLGRPIKGYGETTRRGRRRYVSNVEYEKEGVKHMRMKFYVSGTHRKGTVFLEVKKNLRRKYEYRYLFVELDGYPSRTILLEDNREDVQV